MVIKNLLVMKATISGCGLKKEKKKRQHIGRFEKLFLKIAMKSIHVGGVGKFDQQN